MTNSRRGFLASLLALLPLAKSVQAGGSSVPQSTIRLFNGAPAVGAGVVAASITSTAQFQGINSANFKDFKGNVGSATAVSVLEFQDGSIKPAVFTNFPLVKGATKTYSFYFTTDINTGVKTTVLVAV